MPSPFQFRKYGQCGMDVSEMFPLIAQHVDELAFLRSVYGKSNDHVQATYELNTGKIQMGLPSVGLVGDVRAGLGEPEPAGIRRDLRSSRRTARRTRQLERRVHAGGLPGHRLPLGRRPRSSISSRRPRSRPSSSATAWTCSPS